MKKMFFCFLVFLSMESFAQKKILDNSAVFRGRIVSNQDSIHLKGLYVKNYITGTSADGSIPIDIRIEKSGKFEFIISGIDGPGRIALWDGVTNEILFNNTFFEPGDNIKIDAKIEDNGNEGNLVLHFIGKGAAKYRCSQKLGLDYNNLSIYGHVLTDESNRERVVKLGDSIISAQLAILNQFKNTMSSFSYNLMKADRLSFIYTLVLYGQQGDLNDRFYHNGIPDSVISFRKQKFLSFVRHSIINLPQNVLNASPDYITFMYEKSRWELAFDSPHSPFGIRQFYDRLYRNGRGTVRDKLLGYFLLNDANFPSGYTKSTDQDAREYTESIRNALTMVKTPFIRSALSNVLRSRGKGSFAYNFSLPADSSGRPVKLSDFKGKVVLLDIWAYECTGCTLFTQAFHEAVYPLFKNDSDFKVISIMTSRTTFNKYLFRLRGSPEKGFEKLSTYSYPDYINLFGGRGQPDGLAINNHYRLGAYPFLILIGKKGEIFSWPVPFFMDTKSPDDINVMIQLIKTALTNS